MDYWKALRELYAEKAKLDKAIGTLESLMAGTAEPISRRGRKSMSEDERKEVSERMQKYWASRRKTAKAAKS